MKSLIVLCTIATSLTAIRGDAVAQPDQRPNIISEFESVCHKTITNNDLVTTVPGGFNTSDYSDWQRNDGNLSGLYHDVLSKYRGSIVVDASGNPFRVNGKTVRIPSDAAVRIASGWRNPRRNARVGSVVGCGSMHLVGRALDLVPLVTAGVVDDSATTPLDLHAHLFPTLWAAAKTAGFAIAETGSLPVPCGTFEDHVHVHRRP